MAGGVFHDKWKDTCVEDKNETHNLTLLIQQGHMLKNEVGVTNKGVLTFRLWCCLHEDEVVFPANP